MKHRSPRWWHGLGQVCKGLFGTLSKYSVPAAAAIPIARPIEGRP
jgi:hypothetical protein